MDEYLSTWHDPLRVRSKLCTHLTNSHRHRSPPEMEIYPTEQFLCHLSSLLLTVSSLSSHKKSRLYLLKEMKNEKWNLQEQRRGGGVPPALIVSTYHQSPNTKAPRSVWFTPDDDEPRRIRAGGRQCWRPQYSLWSGENGSGRRQGRSWCTPNRTWNGARTLQRCKFTLQGCHATFPGGWFDP